MNRRTAIRTVAAIAAGAALLPSCSVAEERAVFPLKHLTLTRNEEEMLASLSEAILPKTQGFVGASDLKAHEFVMTMIDDCSSPDDQKKFTDGLKSFADAFQKKTGTSFTNASPEQKTAFLQAVSNRKEVPEEAVGFYSTVKRYTVQSFTSSERYMTDIRKYKMVPGPHYSGCAQA